MLDTLDQQPPDALLALIKLFNADERADKIDLGVGVYRDADGGTPVFGAVKKGEILLVEQQDSKSYLGPEGDMGFVNAIKPHVFGADCNKSELIDGMQTPGGTGAVRIAVALAEKAGAKKILLGGPSWPNHAQILKDVGIEAVMFNHAKADGSADMEALAAAMRGADKDTAVMLHGCCHNPTGIDYTPAQWDEIANLLQETGLLPIIDLAYQGLGNGMEEDAYGLRKVIASVSEVLVAYSCDKNFGVYRDRLGAFYALTSSVENTEKLMSNAAALARANWSMPPDHPAATARLVLTDAALTQEWLEELASMRARIRDVRLELSKASNLGGLNLAPLAKQNGMFAILPLSKAQILTLRNEHGVYMAGSGRINIAGLTMDNIEAFITALRAVV